LSCAEEISGDRAAASGGTEKGKGKIVHIQLQADTATVY